MKPHLYIYLLLVLSPVLASAADDAKQSKNRYRAPDGHAEAIFFVVPYGGHSPESTESTVYVRDFAAEQIASRSFSSGDGEHGLFLESCKWTLDSKYFIFTTTSSGGHSPWHFRTFVYDRKSNEIVALTDYMPPIVSPDMTVRAPDFVQLRVMDDKLPEPMAGTIKEVSLSKVIGGKRPKPPTPAR
jgi:hypothetical protein